MKCVICRNGETRKGTMTATFSEGGCTIVVKDVPADICRTCGEEYMDEHVAQRLVEMLKEAASNGVEVDIRRFQAA